MCNQQAADEESDHRDERWKLKAGEAGDGVPRRAAARVPCPEPDEEPAEHDRDEARHRAECRPREEVGGHKSGEVRDAERGEVGACGVGDRDDAVACQHRHGERTAEEDAESEGQIPQPLRSPVVAEELGAAGDDGGAGVAEVRRDAERAAPDEEQEGNDQADARAGDVPRPGLVVRRRLRTDPARTPRAERPRR